MRRNELSGNGVADPKQFPRGCCEARDDRNINYMKLFDFLFDFVERKSFLFCFIVILLFVCLYFEARSYFVVQADLELIKIRVLLLSECWD